MKFKKVSEGLLVHKRGSVHARLFKTANDTWRGTVHQNDSMTFCSSGTYNDTRKKVTEFLKN